MEQWRNMVYWNSWNTNLFRVLIMQSSPDQAFLNNGAYNFLTFLSNGA